MKQIIASICPFGQKEDRSDKYGRAYELAPVMKGDAPFLLEVEDAWQTENIPGTYNRNTGTWNRRQERITAEQIASDLLKCFAENTPLVSEAQGPGIWLYNPETAEVDRKVQEQRQEAYAWAMVRIARDIHRNPRPGETRVTPQMKAWGRYLGLIEDWQTNEVTDTKACIFCTKRIPTSAVKCPECREIVDREKYAELTGVATGPVVAAAQGEKKAGNGRHVYG